MRASAFIAAGLFAAIAAVIVGGRADAGFPDSGNAVLLAVASVVIGCASLTGGRGTVLGSHNLEETIAVADRVVVLWQGVMVGECPAEPENHELIVALIVGGKVPSSLSTQ